ncbi:hypothetical protein AVEN_221446-1 [Araneus ventricosus]|uniref:Uncharacterized protein n=1 Tax=Araneus ventricosus TaxID=182803 RepID=A0A4Y2PPS6_ARAVE|nr:hypothetical protein AVEN_221446-1 [Araneus ventricosus]
MLKNKNSKTVIESGKARPCSQAPPETLKPNVPSIMGKMIPGKILKYSLEMPEDHRNIQTHITPISLIKVAEICYLGTTRGPKHP